MTYVPDTKTYRFTTDAPVCESTSFFSPTEDKMLGLSVHAIRKALIK